MWIFFFFQKSREKYYAILGKKKSEVNNVSNVITILKANTKSSVGQHRPPTNAEVGSGVMEE
jgi:hypothetical protein